MATPTAYSSTDDLLVGDIPLPRGLLPQKYVDRAAEEIDGAIGFLYQTPVDIYSDASPVARPARLLLKRINNDLATGMLVMAMTTSGQRLELNAYGAKLVADARAVLQQIANNEIILTGAPLIDNGGDSASDFSGPQIANLDAESNVESFYNRIANPGYCFGPVYPYGNNDTGLIVGG